MSAPVLSQPSLQVQGQRWPSVLLWLSTGVRPFRLNVLGTGPVSGAVVMAVVSILKVDPELSCLSQRLPSMKAALTSPLPRASKGQGWQLLISGE